MSTRYSTNQNDVSVVVLRLGHIVSIRMVEDNADGSVTVTEMTLRPGVAADLAEKLAAATYLDHPAESLPLGQALDALGGVGNLARAALTTPGYPAHRDRCQYVAAKLAGMDLPASKQMSQQVVLHALHRAARGEAVTVDESASDGDR